MPAPSPSSAWRMAARIFHMLLPPLFPWLIGEFGYSYSELGLLVSVFFVVSGVGQALSGFLVDRVGARPVLFLRWPAFATAGLVAGTAQGYTGTACWRRRWRGWAMRRSTRWTSPFSTSAYRRSAWAMAFRCTASAATWAGTTAPVFMAGIASATGSWRAACSVRRAAGLGSAGRHGVEPRCARRPPGRLGAPGAGRQRRGR